MVAMDWIVVFSFITTIQRIGQHLSGRVLIQRVVSSVGTTTSAGTGGKDTTRHNGCNDTSRQASNDRTQTSKAVQCGVDATRRARVGVAVGQRAVIVTWTHDCLAEALGIHWRHWIAIPNIANVSQIGTQRSTIDVDAGTSRRVTGIISATIVVITQSGWQVLATSLITEVSRTSIQVIAIHWRVDANQNTKCSTILTIINGTSIRVITVLIDSTFWAAWAELAKNSMEAINTITHSSDVVTDTIRSTTKSSSRIDTGWVRWWWWQGGWTWCRAVRQSRVTHSLRHARTKDTHWRVARIRLVANSRNTDTASSVVVHR